MKYIFILLTIISCSHTHNCMMCKNNSYKERSIRPAMIQTSKNHTTLRINAGRGKEIALTLSDEDLDALECSIYKYRQLNK